MPTYEYKCDACGHQFERFQSITAAPVKTCPECRKNKVQRLIGTGAGLIFKGSGFYITDYRSDSYKTAAKGEGGGSGGSTESKGAGSESKAGGNGQAPAPAPAKPAAKSDAPASSSGAKKKD